MIQLLVGPRLLALVPAMHQAGAAHLDVLADVLAFSDEFRAFRPCEKRWAWSAVLAVQLELALVRLSDPLTLAQAESPSAAVLVYLNGAFQMRYYPAMRPVASAPEAEPANACASSDCRRHNPNLEAIALAFGPMSVLNTLADRSPDHASCYQHSAHLGIVGIGRGATDRQMALGASFEFIERWVALHCPQGVVHASQQALNERAMPPHEVWGVSIDDGHRAFPGYSPGADIQWAPATLEVASQRVFVPLDLVSYLRPNPRPITRQRNSNGCALGNSRDEAALFSTLEIIERDAVLLAWYAQCPPPRLHPSGIDCTTSRELLYLLDASGYDVTLCDLTTEFKVPTVFVLLTGRDNWTLGGFVTASAHPNPRHALRAALAEARSLLATTERNQRQQQSTPATHRVSAQSHNAHSLHYGAAEKRAQFAFLRQAPVSNDCAGFFSAHPFEPVLPEQAYGQVLERIANLGLELIVCDTTPPWLHSLRLHSARAYIPGTINLTFGDEPPVLPASRFQRAAHHLPWMRGSTAPLACPPHPLG